MTNSGAPMSLLVVNRIQIDSRHPKLVSAEVLLGGRPEVVSLDFSERMSVGYVHMPDELDRHDVARKAVIDLMARRVCGKAVELPADLSDVVRQASGPWPMCTPTPTNRAAIEVAARHVEIEIRQVENDHPDPGLTTVHLDFAGTPTVAIIDSRDGPHCELRFRFAEGAHPWQLTPAEQYALVVALVAAAARSTQGA